MANRLLGATGEAAEVGAAQRALRMEPRSIEYGLLGHYRLSLRIASTAAQAATSRIFEIRNPSTTVLIVPTMLRLRAAQMASGTSQENSLDCYRVSGFTVLDSTNTVTPTIGGARSGMPIHTAAVRHLTLTGAAAGMTGGTLVKNSVAFATLPYLLTTLQANWIHGPLNALVVDGDSATHPFVLGEDAGIIVENRVLNVTSYGMIWYLDFAWAETLRY